MNNHNPTFDKKTNSFILKNETIGVMSYSSNFDCWIFKFYPTYTGEFDEIEISHGGGSLPPEYSFEDAFSSAIAHYKQ